MIAHAPRAAADFSLGVEIEGGRIIHLVDEGSPLPARVRRLFTTVSDSQAAVDINILAQRGLRSISLGRLLLSGIARSRRGDPRIEIAMIVDADGIVRVRARDLDTGASQKAAFSMEPRVGEGAAGLKSRIFSLISRVREESLMLPPGHARLAAEVRDAVSSAFISVGGRDTEEMAACILALETILGEMCVIARRPMTAAPGAPSRAAAPGASSRSAAHAPGPAPFTSASVHGWEAPRG